MNKLETFKNDLFEVAAKIENNQILFDAEQVAKSLGFTTVAKSGNTTVRWSRVNGYLPENSLQVGKGDLIPEPLVYKLAFKASNEVAEQFQNWLAIEVIPSIRKHGTYMTNDVLEKTLKDPDYMIGLLTNLKEEKTKREKLEFENKMLEQQVAEAEPKVTYYDEILKSTGVLTITQIAKDYGMSGQELNNLLHDEGVQYKQSGQWLLYKKHQDKGYTKSDTQKYRRSNGETGTKLHTKWTQKGRLFIYNLLSKLEIEPLMDREHKKEA
jgi:phage antirepressor YoqD-like protein